MHSLIHTENMHKGGYRRQRGRGTEVNTFSYILIQIMYTLLKYRRGREGDTCTLPKYW